MRDGDPEIPPQIIEERKKIMKTSFADALGLITVCAGFAVAATAQAGDRKCRLDGAATSLSAECKAERAALRVWITDCMARRADETEASTAGKAKVSAHATRARYLLCTAGVKGTSGLVFP